MSMSKFLSVFQFVIKAVLPGTLALAGVPIEMVTPIVSLAQDAETALGPGTGPQKLQAVVDGIGQTMTAKGADPTTIAAVQGAAVTGINAGFSIATDVQALHAAAINSASAANTGISAAAPTS